MVNIGDKYIIEVEEVYISADDSKDCNSPSKLYRIKGFNSLVFDENGLSKIERADEEKEKSYEDGLNDAWEAAEQISSTASEGGYALDQLYRIFNSDDIDIIYRCNTASEAIEKIKNYENTQNIKVGDEIQTLRDATIGVVLDITDGHYEISTENGTSEEWGKDDIRKTGKHYDEIQVLLEKMRGK